MDHLVDVPALGGYIRIGELLAVFSYQFLSTLGLVFGFFDFLAEDDIDRTLRSHDGDLGAGPGQVDVATDMLARHDVIRAAVGLAGDDRQLGNGRFAERI